MKFSLSLHTYVLLLSTSPSLRHRSLCRRTLTGTAPMKLRPPMGADIPGDALECHNSTSTMNMGDVIYKNILESDYFRRGWSLVPSLPLALSVCLALALVALSKSLSGASSLSVAPLSLSVAPLVSPWRPPPLVSMLTCLSLLGGVDDATLFDRS